MRLRRTAPALVLTAALLALPIAAEPAAPSFSTPSVVDMVTSLWHALVDLLVEEPADQGSPPSPGPTAAPPAPPADPGNGDDPETGGYAEPVG